MNEKQTIQHIPPQVTREAIDQADKAQRQFIGDAMLSGQIAVVEGYSKIEDLDQAAYIGDWMNKHPGGRRSFAQAAAGALARRRRNK